MRGLTAFNASALIPETAQLLISTLSITLWQVELGPGTIETPDLRVAIRAGELLEIASGSDVDMTVSGYVLTLP